MIVSYTIHITPHIPDIATYYCTGTTAGEEFLGAIVGIEIVIYMQ